MFLIWLVLTCKCLSLSCSCKADANVGLAWKDGPSKRLPRPV